MSKFGKFYPLFGRRSGNSYRRAVATYNFNGRTPNKARAGEKKRIRRYIRRCVPIEALGSAPADYRHFHTPGTDWWPDEFSFDYRFGPDFGWDLSSDDRAYRTRYGERYLTK